MLIFATLRLLIVISLILLLALIVNDPNSATMYYQDIHPKNLPVGASIVILLLIGVIGSKIWNYFNLPVPYLTGAMVSVGLFNFFIDDNVYHLDTSLTSLQWPIIIAQI
ncbi:AbrB family transcriptional regulator [Anaerobacillus sp. HL2]|nr:AbrB family transcriptional regulator [Anaerobacillus sp. HL2]